MMIFSAATYLEQIISQIKEDLLSVITVQLKENSITIEEAEKMAQSFLAISECRGEEDFLHSFYRITLTSTAARETFLRFASVYDESTRKGVSTRLSEYLRKGDIQQAARLIKKRDAN